MSKYIEWHFSLLMRFVPQERWNENVPCWFIPLSPAGETVDYYSRCGIQLELEHAVGNWLREMIRRIEDENTAATQLPMSEDELGVARIAGT